VAAPKFVPQVSNVVLFWLAFVLTRPLAIARVMRVSCPVCGGMDRLEISPELLPVPVIHRDTRRPAPHGPEVYLYDGHTEDRDPIWVAAQSGSAEAKSVPLFDASEFVKVVGASGSRGI
jgi:hypothetical protein